MAEESLDQFRRKAHFDLWLHQNNLFWSRFQLLYYLQGAYFLVVGAGDLQRPFVFAALVTIVFFTSYLWIVLNQDRSHRNWHRHVLMNDFGFDPLRDNIAGFTFIDKKRIEGLFQRVLFFPLMLIDGGAAAWGNWRVP
jgi:hypothetical protein